MIMRNPDGSISVGILTAPEQPKPEEAPAPVKRGGKSAKEK